MEKGTAVLVVFFALIFLSKFFVILSTDGGYDISGADLPKTIMFIEGSNPYAVSSWAAPYPPFYFLFMSGILVVSSGFNVVRPTGVLIFALRFAALVFDVATGFVIYLAVSRKNLGNFKALAISFLYFIVSVECQIWFHGDSFGFFFVALSVFFFMSERYSLGSFFLGLSVILKIHPFLSLVPITIWLYRRRAGFPRNVAIFSLTVLLGLVVPVMLIPHAFEVLIGYNASTSPLYTQSLFNFFYTILPIFFHQQVSVLVINAVWVAATFSMLVMASFIVWRNYERLEFADVLVLGLVAWILPLRQVLNFYLIWYTVPFLMKGNLRRSVPIVALQVVGALAIPFGWAGFEDWSTLPLPSSALVFFAIAVLYAVCGLLAFLLSTCSVRQNPVDPSTEASPNMQKSPICQAARARKSYLSNELHSSLWYLRVAE